MLEAALLRRASTGSHQSAAGTDGRLAIDLEGLLDVVLVDVGGHTRDGSLCGGCLHELAG